MHLDMPFTWPRLHPSPVQPCSVLSALFAFHHRYLTHMICVLHLIDFIGLEWPWVGKPTTRHINISVHRCSTTIQLEIRCLANVQGSAAPSTLDAMTLSVAVSLAPRPTAKYVMTDQTTQARKGFRTHTHIYIIYTTTRTKDHNSLNL
jgi:hypothetical protein